MSNSSPFASILWGLTANSFVSFLLLFAMPLVVMLMTGHPLIAWLKRMPGMKWTVREDTPESHKAKGNTPSMGGLGIIGSACFGYVGVLSTYYFLSISRLPSTQAGMALSQWSSIVVAALLLPLFCVAHMVLGFVDDRSKAQGRGGLRARDKFLGQLGLAFALLLFLICDTYFRWTDLEPIWPSPNTAILLPTLATFAFLLIVLIGTCNATNITDGIDGLAAGIAVQAFVALFAVTLFDTELERNSQPFCLALAGACLGFLNFNRYKAKVFMGDTGSLALGAALAGAAVLTGTVFLLPFIGFIFYVELISVTVQVLYFKWSRKRTGEGKRLFRRAPLHHHYELGGWTEWRVVLTFWAINLLMVIIGLFLWSKGILPRFPYIPGEIVS
jgi:phospho-N-acetylmuramoyl-pentapeptide-transferase